MKWNKILAAGLLALSLSISSAIATSQRPVVIEEFTGTW